MSTFLELVNLARVEAGMADGDLSTLQQGLNAEALRFKTWVREEWKQLQARHADWQFLRRSFEFDTVAGQGYYTPQQAKATDDGTSTGVAILADWKLDSLRISTAGSAYADEGPIGFLPYDAFRDFHELGAARAVRAQPIDFTVRPSDNALGFGSVPDGAYTIGGEFYRSAQSLSADSDVPLMPSKYHALIAYLALRAYGIFMAAPEVIGRADEKISVLLSELCADQLPPMTSGPPLG